MAASMIATLLLALLFTSIGFSLINRMNEKTTQKYDKKICQQTVILNSRARIPLVREQEFSLDCPTRYVTFDTKKVTYESRNFKYDDKKITQLLS